MTETYVVDASVLMQYFITDTYTPQVSILLNRLNPDAHLFQIMPVSNLLTRALQSGLFHNLAIYDSFYIALAENLNCPLITVDQRQAKAAIASNVVVKPITDFV